VNPTPGIRGRLQLPVCPGLPANIGHSGPKAAWNLLGGEAQGMASDFTIDNGRGAVSVKDNATAANNYTNIKADDWWTNAGTSPKIVTGSDGVLRWAPHNLCLQSQTFTTTWGVNNATVDVNDTTAPDGTLTAEKITESGGAGIQNIYQSIASLLSDIPYTLSVYVKAGTQSNVGVYFTKAGGGEEHIHATFNLATGATGETDVGTTSGTIVSSSITAVGDGWYRCVLAGRVTETTLYFGVTPLPTATGNTFDSSGEVSYTGTGKTIFVWGAQLNRGTVPTDYLVTTTAARMGLAIDYHSGSYGLLVEPAATNLHIQSINILNSQGAWGDTQATSARNATAPDGVANTATTITPTSTVTGGGVQTVNAPVTAASTTYAASCYFKAGVSGFGYISIGDRNGTRNRYARVINLSDGSLGDSNSVNSPTSPFAYSESVGNGWYRLVVGFTFSSDTTNAGCIFKVGSSPSATPSWDAFNAPIPTNVNQTVIVWGAQLEVGTVATSPIPTFAATVTRAADGINKALSAMPFSATVGTVLADCVFGHATAVTDTNSPRMWVISDGTGSEMFHFVRAATTNAGAFIVTDTNVTQANVALNAMAGTPTVNKMAGAWAVNDFNGAVNGVDGTLDTSGSLPTVTTFYLGNRNNTSDRWPGHVRKCIYLPRRMIDADMEARTA